MKESYTDSFFDIGRKHGFLPLKQPLIKLPQRYHKLQFIIDNLSNILTIDNVNKLTISFLVYTSLDDYTEEIKKEFDIFTIQALFRTYAFICNGFMLDSTYFSYKTSNKYYEARYKLPEKLARPYFILSQKLGINPYLDYGYCYSLGNFMKKNKDGNLHYKNLKMICKFTNSKDERNYSMTQVYINEISNELISSIYDCIENMKNKDTLSLIKSLEMNYKILKEMNKRKTEMSWEFLFKNDEFKIFLMGSKNNEKVFKEGILFEGVNEVKKLHSWTYLYDFIIPTIDIFIGLKIDLDEDKEYRPKCVQNFLEDLQTEMKEYPILEYIKDTESLNLFIKIIIEIKEYFYVDLNYISRYFLEDNTDTYRHLSKKMYDYQDYYDRISLQLKN
jgi:hypothetical protein